MKIKVQEFIVKIPDSINAKQLSVGEKFTVDVSGKSIDVCLLADGRSFMLDDNIIRLGKLKSKNIDGHIIRPVEPKLSKVKKGFGALKSPMTGKIISVAVKNDDNVKVGDVLVIIEAMKMENRILAEGEGVVNNIKVTNGVNVTAGDNLLTLVAKK